MNNGNRMMEWERTKHLAEKYLTDFNQLEGLNIYIYGSGKAGTTLKKRLECMGNLNLVAFLDSSKSGCMDGLEVIRIDDYTSKKDNMIVIASVFLEEIMTKLKEYDIEEYLIDPQFDFIPDNTKEISLAKFQDKLLNIDEIQKFKDKNIYLYGAGGAGKSFKNLIDTEYPELSVTGFIDTYKDGRFDGKEVIKIGDYEHVKGNIILVTSCKQEEIANTLNFKEIRNYYIVDAFWLFRFMYSQSERRKNKNEIDKVMDLLHSDKDKELYEYLLKARTYHSGISHIRYSDLSKTTVLVLNDPDALKNHFPKHVKKQYLDFVSIEAIENVVQAGVYDGSDIIEINAIAPNFNKVYGFEPLGTRQLLPQIDPLIKAQKVVIEPYALYDKATSVNFFPCQAGSYISPYMTPTTTTTKIETITLDDYFSENDIEDVDFICCDIENAERQFLIGARNTIRKCRPQLAISIYHSKEQFIEIPLLLDSMLNDYIFKLGHYSHTLNETTLYAIPCEIYDHL